MERSGQETYNNAETIETKHTTPSTYQLSFQGNGWTLFGIWIINTFLTIITLGIYRFWGKARLRKYLHGSTELMNERFVYYGKGKELFIGWLKAVAIFVPGYSIIFVLTMYVNTIFSILFPIFTFIIIPFAKTGVMKYRLSRTSWCGIRFSFRGSYKDAIISYTGGLILTVITLGLYYPYFSVKMRRFWTNNTYFGNTQVV